MINVIRQYLVSLGFHVDTPSLNTAQHAMNTVEKSIASFSDTALKRFAVAGTAVTAFFLAAEVGTAKFIMNLGQADLQTQIFARRMWMSVDSARAYQNAIEALGVSLQDLYLSPELMQRYIELRKEAFELQMPSKEYEQEMKAIRDITFEFQRLKLEGTYALQWIGYYLNKYLEPVLGKSGTNLKNINDLIQQKMPQWTEKVAQFVSWFARMGVAAWDIRGALGAIVAVFAGFKLINMGPLGLMIAGLTALLLLLDDFNTYKNGGQSALPQLWEWVDKTEGKVKEFFDSFKDSGELDKFIQALAGLVTSFKDVSKATTEALDELAKLAGYEDFGDMLTKNTLTFIKRMVYMLEGVVYLLKATVDLIKGLITGDFSQWFQDLKDEFGAFNKGIFGDDALPGGAQRTAFRAPNYLYPQRSIATTNNVTMKPTYNIYGAAQRTAFRAPNYLYPQRSIATTNNVTMKPTYNIYGAAQPDSVVRTVHRSNVDLMTRTFQGVVR
ncbi:hypothetical protein JCM15765_03940 [Paradesulfitobacterium aromaticivorans]